MPKVADQQLALARVYATAMLGLAQSQGEVDTLFSELRDFADRVEKDAELASFLSSPTVGVEARRNTVEKLFRGRRSDLFVDAMQVLNRKGRLSLITSVTEAYRLERETLQGRVEVHVRTAAPLTDKLRERLRDVVSRRTGKEPDLVETVDESVLGGLVVQIGDTKLDASVATKLRRLNKALRERASREIHHGRAYFEDVTAE